MNAEEITPYHHDDRNKALQVETMFDNIAPAYDFMNRAMTMGIDRIWRRKAVKMLAASHPGTILDVATGTGDLAILLASKIPGAHITGIDLSTGMIDIGRQKIIRKNLADRITLSSGDCLHLPFDDCSFDAVTVAYGVRNFEDIPAGYAEMLRVLRPGGTIVVIELATPTSPLIRPLYNIYTRHIIPAVGRLFSHDTRAYSYLPESIAAVQQRSAMTDLMTQVGFSDARFRSLTFGTCCIYTATKPITS